MNQNDAVKVKLEPTDSDNDAFIYRIDTTRCKIEDDAYDTPKVPETKDLPVRKSVGKFSQYHKKKVLDYLLGNPYHPELFNAIQHRFQTSQNDIFKWLDEGLKDAQKHVHEECNSINFTNIIGWLEYMKNIPALQNCCYEPAMIMNAIANNEVFPEPSELEGIDLKAVYQFLYHALLGLPQPHLDPVSGAFLANEFQNLVDDINRNASCEQLCQLRIKLRPYFMKDFSSNTTGFDPFNLLDVPGGASNPHE